MPLWFIGYGGSAAQCCCNRPRVLVTWLLLGIGKSVGYTRGQRLRKAGACGLFARLYASLCLLPINLCPLLCRFLLNLLRCELHQPLCYCKGVVERLGLLPSVGGNKALFETGKSLARMDKGFGRVGAGSQCPDCQHLLRGVEKDRSFLLGLSLSPSTPSLMPAWCAYFSMGLVDVQYLSTWTYVYCLGRHACAGELGSPPAAIPVSAKATACATA